VVGTWTPDLRFKEPARVQDVLLEGSTLRAQCAAVDGMIRIAFDVDYLWRNVLGFVADRINQDATAY
jgi:hypothetical protein